ALQPGTIVAAPLGPRLVMGVVWDAAPTGESEAVLPAEKLKPVAAVIDLPPMTRELRRTVDWIAAYTVTPPGAVLRMALIAADPAPPATREAFRRAEALPEDAKLTPSRRRVLDALARLPLGMALTAPDLAREAGVGAGVVKAMAESGLLDAVALQGPGFRRPDPSFGPPGLTDAQSAAAEVLVEQAQAGRFAVTLLDGVTGSGKTAVYLEAVSAAVAAGKQALVLLPEIALSSEWLARFAARFGCQPALWHSDVASGQRRRIWRAVAEGEATVVVGARSALFLPFRALGLVVVDEEHDAAFKQEDGVVYHARDMAVLRGREACAPVVLASATPSLETLANVESGRYGRLVLAERHGGAAMPDVAAIDLRAEPPSRNSFLSPPLRQALAETLAAGEQALLYLNRRGYAPLTLCRSCGHRFECPNCTAWMVEHRLARRLACHHCGTTMLRPRACPACGEEDTLVACGPGVERVAEEVQSLHPSARIGLMTSDQIGGPQAIAELIQRVQRQELDVLIGTQMVAKGHNFPLLTLVGVVDADLGLSGGDLRAGERTWQLLHQVAGRAGRGQRPGRVLLQSWEPRHPVIRAMVSGDREGFQAAELAQRAEHGLPPFGRLAALVVSAPTDAMADAAARALAAAAPRQDGLRVLGPAPAPLAVLRGRHRRRFLVKAARGVAPQPALRDWLRAVKLPGAVRVQVDIDPYSFL
ncbi:MAG: primosomal protein N', partial [Alphaproteobacteria bacterium]|nr:primosomal protein N' [Alphaproteobacteria bacterium]